MSIALYDISVPVFKRGLTVLSNVLKKGEAFADENNIPHEKYLSTRLVEDMAALPFQIQRVSDTAKNSLVRLTGKELPALEDNETTFADLQERIQKTIALLDAADPKDFEGKENAQVILKQRGGEIPLTGTNYVLQYAIPNFYFHVTTAYDILRHLGVPFQPANAGSRVGAQASTTSRRLNSTASHTAMVARISSHIAVPCRSPFRHVLPSWASSRKQRSFHTSPPRLNQAVAANFGFAFDIDGVLLRSAKPIPGAAEALQFLHQNKIPFILITNGGGKPEAKRAAEIAGKLGVDIDENSIVQSHTPFKGLLDGTICDHPGVRRDGLKDKNVLVVGGDAQKTREVAEGYGFQKVILPADVYVEYPQFWPFSRRLDQYYQEVARPLLLQDGTLTIDGIMVFNDPRDWGMDTQLIVDLLLSQNGVFGTLSEKNNDDRLPNRGYQQDGQPHLYISNPDLWWASEWPLPRLGQGGFVNAFEGVWNAITGGPDKGVILQRTIIGKPHHLTYEYAENQLDRNRRASNGEKVVDLQTMYMIGDNPESDIRGANNYQSLRGTEWNSVLVRTGVYRGSAPPKWVPTTIQENVLEAVKWACRKSKFPVEI